MVPVLLAFGANLGNPAQQIREAAEWLRKDLPDLRLSSLYRSAAMYREDQPEFLNATGLATTTLSPRALLCRLKACEHALGRQQREPNGPREIDLDVLAYGNLRYRFQMNESIQLETPHARLQERRFVLQPLRELVGEWPWIGSIDHLLGELEDDPLERHDEI